MNENPAYAEIARNWDLWCMYVDPDATMTFEEWNSLSMFQRIEIMVACFGLEEGGETK